MLPLGRGQAGHLLFPSQRTPLPIPTCVSWRVPHTGSGMCASGNGAVGYRGNENSQGHLALRKLKLCWLKRPVCKFLDSLLWQCHRRWQGPREENGNRSGPAGSGRSGFSAHLLGVHQCFINWKCLFVLRTKFQTQVTQEKMLFGLRTEGTRFTWIRRQILLSWGNCNEGFGILRTRLWPSYSCTWSTHRTYWLGLKIMN